MTAPKLTGPDGTPFDMDIACTNVIDTLRTKWTHEAWIADHVAVELIKRGKVRRSGGRRGGATLVMLNMNTLGRGVSHA
jgi:hypothetical protein